MFKPLNILGSGRYGVVLHCINMSDAYVPDVALKIIAKSDVPESLDTY
jgi:hypothetical protein